MTQRVVNYTYGTGNPVLPDGSIDVRDGIDNLQSLDIFMNSDEDTYNQRDGDIVKTLAGAVRAVGIQRIGDFTTGCTVTERNQGVLHQVDGTVYVWLGALPKTVPAASSPATTGGIGPAGWLDVGDASLRGEIASDGGDGLIGRFKSVNQMKASTKPSVGGRYSVLGYSSQLDGGAGDWLAVDSATNPANGVTVVQSTVKPSVCFSFIAAIGGVVNAAQVGAAPAGDVTAILNALHADARVTKIQVSPPSATQYYTVSGSVTVRKDMEFINNPTLTFTSQAATLSIESPSSLVGFKVYCNNTSLWSHKAIRVKSSDVSLKKFTIENAVEVPYGQFSTGVEIGTTSTIYNVSIEDSIFSRCRTTIAATNVENLKVNNLRAFKYVTSVYLKDVKHSRLKDAYMYGRSSVLTGRPGENGVLVEATVDNGCVDVEVEGYFVQECGEHGFRLGGQHTITDFKFKSCTSLLSGQAWKENNQAAGEWHGGCGFKVLGGTNALGHQHRRIELIDCTAIDCSDNYGSYPAGHGVNNFSSFLIMMADGVTMNGCKSMKITNVTASGSHGLLIGAASNVTVSGGKLKDSYLACVRLFDESAEFGGVSSQVGVSDIQIDTNASMTRSAPIIRLSSNVNPVSDVTLSVVGAGGNGLAYSEPVGATSYLRVFLNGFYTGSESGSEPVVWGSSVAIINITAPWRGYSPSALNGSSLTDYVTGDYKYKKSGSWITR